MESGTDQKVTAEHLGRNAYIYVRQAILGQGVEKTESLQRQYALRERAIALGWKEEQVITIDGDLGRSGISTDRAGFRRLVSEVGLGRAGIVMALDVSRLTRRASDWYGFVDSCALTGTLLWEDGRLYDPSRPEDRVLLGPARSFREPEGCRCRRRQGKLLREACRGARGSRNLRSDVLGSGDRRGARGAQVQARR